MSPALLQLLTRRLEGQALAAKSPSRSVAPHLQSLNRLLLLAKVLAR
jgi:hypothetical protein